MIISSPPQSLGLHPPLQPTFRSGSVARTAGMPVATLRIWEQRYQAVKPNTAPSGHRLYSAADVERVTLLRRLTEHGHAIGLLAGLDMAQLQELDFKQASPQPRVKFALPSSNAPIKIIVVGQAMAQRLKRLTVHNDWARPLALVGVFGSLTEAIQGASGSASLPADLLLWQASGLQVGALSDLQAAKEAWSAHAVAVAYRFSSAAARDELLGTGADVVCEPTDDEALRQWLSTLVVAPVRRFDDVALTAFAGLSSSIACECPGHLAQLLMQISNFEAYSADCVSRSSADAQLHAYLQRVAGAARVLFENALERVAVEEGLPLPEVKI